MGIRTMRILDRQYIDNSDITGALSTVNDSVAANLLGSKLFITDQAGNNVAMLYAQLSATSVSTITIGGAVYWVDQTRGIVSNNPAQAYGFVTQSDNALYNAAGIQIGTVLAAGSYGWFHIGGYFATIPVGTVTKGDILVLSNLATLAPTANTWIDVAVKTAAPTAESISQLFVFCPAAGTTSVAGIVMGACGQP